MNKNKNNVSDKFSQSFNFITEELTHLQNELAEKDAKIAKLEDKIAKLKAANRMFIDAYNAAKECDVDDRKNKEDWYRGKRARALIEDMIAKGINITQKNLSQLGVANPGAVYDVFRREYDDIYKQQKAARKLAKNENSKDNTE